MSIKWNQFIAALLIGVVLGALVSPHLRRHFRRHMDKKSHHERMVKRFSSRLDLTPEQRVQVSSILEAKRTKVDALLAETRPRFDQIRAETSGEIRKILNADQQGKYEKLEMEMEDRFKKRFAGHP